MPRPSTYAGTYFRGLYVVDSFASYTDSGSKKHTMTFLCLCGEAFTVGATTAKKTKTLVCDSCRNELSSSRAKHRLYSKWSGLVDRCYNSASPAYKYYGAKGVKVCDAWLGLRPNGERRTADGFENFAADMGLPPPGASIDRIDPTGDYAPDNCRWATAVEQANNKRDTIKLTYEGRTLSIPEWTRAFSLPKQWASAAARHQVPLDVALAIVVAKPFAGSWVEMYGVSRKPRPVLVGPRLPKPLLPPSPETRRFMELCGFDV
jgi:hypothetical protein